METMPKTAMAETDSSTTAQARERPWSAEGTTGSDMDLSPCHMAGTSDWLFRQRYQTKANK